MYYYFSFRLCDGENVGFFLVLVTPESPDSLLSQQAAAEYRSPFLPQRRGVTSVGTLRLEERNISHSVVLTLCAPMFSLQAWKAIVNTAFTHSVSQHC